MTTKETTNEAAALSQRKSAIVAGVAIVIMAILAGFVYGFVLNSLVVKGDAAATARNIKASEILFRIGIFGWLANLILDVLAAWALYIFFKPVNKAVSLLAAILRLVYVAILGTALLNFVFVLLLLTGADYLKVFETAQLHGLVLLFINAFEGIWSIGLVVFGLHIFALGYLVFRAGFIPTILGALLILGSLGYLITDSANLLLPNYEDYKATVELIFIVPMIFGELGLGLWLLIRGGTEKDLTNRSILMASKLVGSASQEY